MTKEGFEPIFHGKMEAVAQLSDLEFQEYALEKSLLLPSALREKAAAFIHNLGLGLLVLPSRVIYIPISHGPLNSPDEHKTKIAVAKVLGRTVGNSLIANGESVSKVQSQQGIRRSHLRFFREMTKWGLTTNIKSQQKTLSGFEMAITEYLAEHQHIKGVGVDSFDGNIVSTAVMSQALESDRFNMEQNLDLIATFAAEARTRNALNRATVYLDTNQELIFFQGSLHQNGVTEWCKRHTVPYQILTPETEEVEDSSIIPVEKPVV